MTTTEAPALADTTVVEPVAPETPAWFWWALGAVLAGALAVRLVFVYTTQSHVVLAGDAYWYHWQARLVADGRGFLNPYDFFKHHVVKAGADHPPAFIILLAIADWVGISGEQAQRTLTCVIGTASVLLIALIVRRLFNHRAALIAAVLAALYPNLWINDGMLMSESLYIFFVAVSVLLAYRFWKRPRWPDLLGLAAALTLTALTRAEAVLLLPFFLVPFVLARRSVPLRDRLRFIVASAGVALVLLAPWVGYNLSRYREPVFLSTGSGQTLAVGNCDATYSGTFLGFYSLECLRPPNATPPTGGDYSQQELVWRRQAKHYITHHLGDLPKVVAAREGRIWGVYRVRDQETLDWFVEGRGNLQQVRWAQWFYWGLLPLAAVGLVVFRRRRVPASPLLAQFALAAVVAAISFGVTRYRAGAEVGLVIFAGVGVEAAARWSLRKVRDRTGRSPARRQPCP